MDLTDPYTALSVVGLAGFGLVGLYLLYQAWRFMSYMGRTPLSMRYHRKLREQYSQYSDGMSSRKGKGNMNPFFAGHKGEYIYHFFHIHLVRLLYGAVCLVLATYYLLQLTGVLWYTRPIDLVLVNPYRWWLLQPLGAVVIGILASMFVNHYLIDMAIVGLLGMLGRSLLGFALLLFPVNTSLFWLTFAIAAVMSLVSILFLWGRESARTSRSVAVLFYLIYSVALYVVFLASWDVFGVFGFVTSEVLYLVLDAVVILPALVVSLQWYYVRYGMPLFPLFVYQAYGLGHWWSLQTTPELHRLWPSSVLMYKKSVARHHHHGKGGKRTDTREEYELIVSKCNLCGHKDGCRSGNNDEREGTLVDDANTAELTGASDMKKKRSSNRREGQQPVETSSSGSDSESESESQEGAGNV